ncbi:MAG: NPCBM/NEW2 domain-containing protein [Ruminococcus sp.]|nr:NPCBM/NEW2 domain-containing protein [Ruminococcus sp.]
MKKDNKSVKKVSFKDFGLIFCFISILLIMLGLEANYKSYSIIASNEVKEFVYLSDIPYIKEQSNVGWGSITLDQNLETNYNNGIIALIVNGKSKNFLKGVSAHATSTLIYNISELDYDYFSTYYGVDASRGTNGNGVKFSIYTSVDGINWDLHTLASPPVKKGNSEAEFINIDIRGKNYIKLYAHNNGNADSDHAVYANAKLYKEGYSEIEDDTPYSFIKTLDEYDAILSKSSYQDLITTKEMTLLQRKFVNNFGYDLLQGIAHLDNDRKETLEWIMNDYDALKYYITGGKPIGSYMSSLNVLIKLYTTYKNDLKNNTRTSNGIVLGDLYKRMMISLSLTHSANVCLWIGGNQCSDAVTRYDVYKKMQANNLLVNKIFETLNIEEMRWVMNNLIDDEEIEWLNHHIRRYNTNIDPYRYITYRFGYNYSLAKYYSAENYDTWNNKYHLSDYNITYQTGKPKLWIVFEEGSVCGGLSKTGSNINACLGKPSGVIGQPGHAAYLEYSETTDGKGMWTIKNDVGGWTVAEKGERLLCGWGSNSWDSYYNVTYVPYAQEALNDLENYNKALETMLLADLYQNDVNKLEEIYLKALEYQPINMDAWYGLIRTYQKNTSKTGEDYIALAKKLTESMYYFPVPMHDLMNLISGNLNNTKYALTYTNYLREALEKGTQLNSNNSPLLQPSISKTMANHLLGKNDYTIATFSFNGDNANKIMLGSKYEGNGVRWEYSLDGGNNWTATSDSYVLLSAAEINSITAQNDIKIHIVGVDYSAANIYTIDILDNIISESSYYRNDLENRIMGVNLVHEWRNSENDPWTSYADASPNNTGNKTLQIRQIANGTKLSSNILTFTFTEDNQPDTRKYIPVSHLSVHGVSSQATGSGQNGQAANAIDGNYNTRWHSAWNGSDNQKYIIIKFDKPIYLSAIEYVPADGGNGKIMNAKFEGSMDGENYDVDLGFTSTWGTDSTWGGATGTRVINFSDAYKESQIQYLKITGTRTSTAGGGSFIAARMFNFYQDVTKNSNPTGGVGYSTTEPTRDNVVARLVNLSSDNITILNPTDGSDTYTFTDNGDFTFEFRDNDTNKVGTAIAKVNWIDREPPIGTIEYSRISPTNKEVIATLKVNEEVTVLREIVYSVNEEGEVLDSEGNVLSGYSVDDEFYVRDDSGRVVANINPYRHEFVDNGEYTFEFIDKAGNKGMATAKVDWIDRDAPIATFTYDIAELTNSDVTVTIDFNEETTITNNNNSNSYTFTDNGDFTFEFKDKAGNTGEFTAKVIWIDKIAPTAGLTYNRSSKDKATVTVVNPSEDIIFIDGDGTYEYTKNGTYEISFKDKAGNIGTVTAVIDWLEIESDNPNDNKPVNPDDNKPDNPNDNKPVNPDENKPDNPNDNNPVNPDENKPDNPNDNNPVNPDENKPDNSNNSNQTNPGNNKPNTSDNNNQNTNQNKPNSGNNNSNNNNQVTPGGTDNPSNNDNPSDNNTGVSNDYKIYTSENVTVELPIQANKDNLNLKYNPLLLVNSELIEKFGTDSTYFEIYFTNNYNKKEEIITDDYINITIKIDSFEDFASIYSVDNNKLEALGYEVVGDNKIKIRVKNLSQYLITKKKKPNYYETKPVKDTVSVGEKKNHNYIWFVASAVNLIIGIVIIIKYGEK